MLKNVNTDSKLYLRYSTSFIMVRFINEDAYIIDPTSYLQNLLNLTNFSIVKNCILHSTLFCCSFLACIINKNIEL